MAVGLLRTSIIMLTCWRMGSAQDTYPGWHKTALVVSNLPFGLGLIYEFSLHRFDGLTPIRGQHGRVARLRQVQRIALLLPNFLGEALNYIHLPLPAAIMTMDSA